MSVNDQVDRFWKTYEVLSSDHRSAEELQCKRIFSETYKRLSDGKFEVSLILKEDCGQVEESPSSAERRLLSMERRLKRYPIMEKRYQEYLNEFIVFGHMSRVADQSGEFRDYVPHHVVVKEASITTKLRVICYASCKTTLKISLNDCVMTRPIAQQKLFEIIAVDNIDSS